MIRDIIFMIQCRNAVQFCGPRDKILVFMVRDLKKLGSTEPEAKKVSRLLSIVWSII